LSVNKDDNNNNNNNNNNNILFINSIKMNDINEIFNETDYSI